jgi:hypothetical protein
MLGGGSRDARRTERYLDGLLTADERRAEETPADAELDPAIRHAARELRYSLTRVHPSFRFEESLAARLAAGALRLKAGLPVWDEAPATAGTVAPFRGSSSGAFAAGIADIDAAAAEAATGAALEAASGAGLEAAPGAARLAWPAAAFRHLPDRAPRPSRPLIFGGVGVASAALSLGAVYVAWRYSHPSSGRMGRAVRAAHNREGHAGTSRRSGVIEGIFGVVS